MAQQSSAGDVSGGGSPAGRSADRPAPEAMPPPRLSVTVQPREDLYAMLDAVAARDVPGKILISAAAGTGKTVLVASWLARETTARETAWLALGPADNDAEELRRRVVGLWERLSSAGRPTVLVLDDAHEVRDDAALGVLASLVDSAPAHSTVVVAGRRTPDLPFSRYALDGTLTWIGWAELALGRPEAAAIVAEYGHSLGESDLDALLELTRGWAAPLRLAAIRLSNHTDPSGAIADLVRYPQRISEYVVAETLDALPAYLLRFIEATSIVEFFDADLAEQLDEASVDRVASDREKFGVPVVRCSSDAAGVRYGWHPLIRAHACAAVRGRDPQRVARLHRTAARWFLEARDPLAALEHLVALGDEAAIENFALLHGPTVVFDGRTEGLWNLLGARYADLPAVRYLRALAAVEQNYPDAARAFLGTPSSAPAPRGVSAATVFAAALSVEIAVIGGSSMPKDALAAFEECGPTGSADLDCYVALQHSVARMFLGDPASSERLLREALTLGDVGAHPRLILRTLARLSILSGVIGDLATMSQRAGHALEYAVAHGLTDRIDAFQCAAAVCMDTYVRCEQLPDDSPVHALALTAPRRTRPDGTSAPVSGGHAEVAFALLQARRTVRPTTEEADAVSRALIGLLSRGPQAGLSNTLVTPAMAVVLDAGRTNTAAQVIEKAADAFGEIPDVVVARAMVELHVGRTGAAGELLATVRDRPLHPALAVRAWLLDAVVANREHRSDDASVALSRALELAEPARIVMPFLDCAADAAELLAALPPGGEHTHEFVVHVKAKLLDANAGRNPGLTRTEKVVLGELATGRQLREIARELHVSLNTVRTHTRNLYRKLDVASRTEAVETATRRGLL
ncbi:LuxR family transcriptional regulator [Rhodococcus hoagii]|nr:LuxR family transcriptional regulator [Prescottella equi]NKZ90870.1 LuxR family transcriptional regulator [Prescottella equi]